MDHNSHDLNSSSAIAPKRVSGLEDLILDVMANIQGQSASHTPGSIDMVL